MTSSLRGQGLLDSTPNELAALVSQPMSVSALMCRTPGIGQLSLRDKLPRRAAAGYPARTTHLVPRGRGRPGVMPHEAFLCTQHAARAARLFRVRLASGPVLPRSSACIGVV